MTLNPTTAPGTGAPRPTLPAATPQAPGEEPSGGEGPGGAKDTETTLWELLTPEEQAVFRERSIRGSMVYGPGGRPAGRVPVPTGRTIDVRG